MKRCSISLKIREFTSKLHRDTPSYPLDSQKHIHLSTYSVG